MKKRNMIILLILILTIGFASVSTTLVLNGTIGIGLKNNDFEVIFVEALLDGTESSKANIGVDKKTITFNTDKLTNVGDTTELVYKVKNNSTQYGANVTINCTNDASEYINVESTFNSQPLPLVVPVLMEPQEVRMGRITAELIKGYAGEDNSINIECKINASATEDDNIAEYVPNRYREDILNGADPILAKGLVPITIENDGTVKKADITSEWYSYENKKWANAVILEDESVTYNAGETIPEDNIESYFVWIPKYSYQLWDLGKYDSLTELDSSKVHTIPVKFGLTNTSDNIEGECTTPMNEDKTQGLSGESKNCEVGDYMTHPAFISMNTNGLWMGKFETGYKGATTTNAAQVNNNEPEKVQIKPNVYSWNKLKEGNAYLTSYNYKRELDSHMMKNTEWGAVAYLQHSSYGSATSVRINNNNYHITGYAAVKEPTQGFGKYVDREGTALGVDGNTTINYKNPLSQVASTTGNYTGIYDMSGGCHEYTLSFTKDEDGNIISRYNSNDVDNGFKGIDLATKEVINDIEIPAEKYWDYYLYQNNFNSYKYLILGDATGEVGPFAKNTDNNRPIGSWYDDEGYGPSVMPYTVRGGSPNRGNGTGIFASDNHRTTTYIEYGFRIVLAV